MKNVKQGKQSCKAQNRKKLANIITPNKILAWGKIVYSVDYDSGAPGPGGDFICVYRWREKYALFLTFDEPEGPFDSLSKAIASYELNKVTEATVSISSTELSAEQIAKTLRSEISPPYSININGEVWILNNKRKFVRKD